MAWEARTVGAKKPSKQATTHPPNQPIQPSDQSTDQPNMQPLQ